METITREEMEQYLLTLKERFNEIDPTKYYMSYSGGRDSHFLFWFMRIWLKDNDPDMYERFKAVDVVSINTRMEHPEILNRMMKNADIIVLPDVKPFEYKADIGIPCFTKMQDGMIRRYQKGNRSYSTMKFVHGVDTDRFKLNNRAREALLNGNLHKIGDCCKALKKDPLYKYAAKSGRLAIIGVRQSESLLRKVNYTSHMMKTGKFTPIFDLGEPMLKAIEVEYGIEVPDIYRVLHQTGCMGCPYGRNILEELKTLPKVKRDFTIELFRESYDLKGVKYQTLDNEVDEIPIDKILEDRAARRANHKPEEIEEIEEESDDEE
jgi:3'-phosphoadenosine 5'-phosphosulfate sulfotransferase (PAPS reductase)/FAD synthetase